MAKLVPFLGNISGKIAGNVFASGKGGAYIRQFVKPTNANSNAQKRARAAFAAGSRGWSLLSAVAKNAWNEFAIASFSPKFPKPGVTYSGASAYASFLNQCQSVNAARDTGATIQVGMTSISLLDQGYSTPSTAPNGKFTGQVYSKDLEISAPLNLNNLVLNGGDGGSCTLMFDIYGSGIDPETFTSPVFVDQVTGEKFGFAVYVSSRIASGTTKPAQVQKALYCACSVIEVAPADEPIEAAPWNISLDRALNLVDSKYNFALGSIVDADVYAISQGGASVLIGSKQVTIS